MKGFLEYIPGNSLLHLLNPLTKLLFSLLLCAACFISPNPFFSLGIIGLNPVMAASAGLLTRAIALLRTMVKLSIVLFFLQVFFVREGTPLISLSQNIIITDQGIHFSLLIVLRLMAATLPLTLVLCLTQLNDLSGALVRCLGIPYKYAFALTTAIRFIPVFASEMQSIMEAQTARGVEFDSRNPLRKIRLILPLCVPLLVSSVQRIEGSALAAQLRGFNLRQRNSGYRSYPFTFSDLMVTLLGLGLILLALLL